LGSTAKGINREKIGKAFKESWSSKASGLGIGLSLANDIVKMHKGKIDMKPNKGKGAVVKIILPRNT